MIPSIVKPHEAFKRTYINLKRADKKFYNCKFSMVQALRKVLYMQCGALQGMTGRSRDGRITFGQSPEKSKRPYLPNKQKKQKCWDVVRMVECSSSNYKALSSNPTKNKVLGIACLKYVQMEGNMEALLICCYFTP
jgi:hypothetical protein